MEGKPSTQNAQIRRFPTLTCQLIMFSAPNITVRENDENDASDRENFLFTKMIQICRRMRLKW